MNVLKLFESLTKTLKEVFNMSDFLTDGAKAIGRAFTGDAKPDEMGDADNDMQFSAVPAPDESYALAAESKPDTMPIPQKCGNVPSFVFDPNKDFEVLVPLFVMYKGIRSRQRFECPNCENEWHDDIDPNLSGDDYLECRSCDHDGDVDDFIEEEVHAPAFARTPTLTEVLAIIPRDDLNVMDDQRTLEAIRKELGEYFVQLSGGPMPSLSTDERAMLSVNHTITVMDHPFLGPQRRDTGLLNKYAGQLTTPQLEQSEDNEDDFDGEWV
jgi:hypothetical protein